ncbi:unnamed protein product [Heterobilharzia americana]|nr:unnamed protein product [Heterobilharzia americana]
MKQSANQLSNELNQYYNQIESAMTEHLRIVEERQELQCWLTEEEQKLIEMNKPLQTLLFSAISTLKSSSMHSLNVLLSSWSSLISERQSILQNIKRILQNLSSRRQQLLSFEERQSLALLNFKTYIIDRTNNCATNDTDRLIPYHSSMINLNQDYNTLINRCKETINEIEKIIEHDTKFSNLANILSLDLNNLSDINNSTTTDQLLINSQDLWTRELIQNKIDELNQQIRDISLKNIYEKLNTFKDIFNNSIASIEPEKNLAVETIDLIKNQIDKFEERLNHQTVLFQLILSQMQDMSKVIELQEDWRSQLLAKVEKLESQLPVDLKSKRTLLIQCQEISTEITEHMTEINEILRNSSNCLSPSVISQKSITQADDNDSNDVNSSSLLIRFILLMYN